MNKPRVLDFTLLLIGALALMVVPFVTGKYGTDLATKIMIYAIFALSLELLVGRTGLVCFGHAAFFGIAAYCAALLSSQTEAVSIWWLLPAALAITALYALVMGALSLRTKGVYFIMVTLAFAQMAYYVFHDTKIGGGTDGIYMYFKPTLTLGSAVLLDLEKPLTFYFFVFALLIAVFGLLALVGRSRFGHALAGIKSNEQRMRAAGFATYFYKLAAFVLSATLAGVAGFLWAVKDGFVNPEMLSWHLSGSVLIMIILGGLGSLRGAILGAAAYVLLRELFQSQALFGELAKSWQLFMGAAIIACVALMPNGLVGLGSQLRAKFAKATP
ncbi:MAG: branched-chain amino acid ABC transporter permease [Burkholderiaceae bacterium]